MIEYLTLFLFFVAAFSSIFTIVNPISTATIFISITKGDNLKKKKKMAKKASIVAGIVLIVFGLIGTYILSFFSITLDAFRIAGGFLVALVGYHMLNAEPEKAPTEKQEKEALAKEDVSIIPLAIPLLSGPGAMTTAIVLMSGASIIEKILIVIAILIVSVLTYFILINADIIDRVLGENGRKVVEKILGLIVIVVGVQFIINGSSGVVEMWAQNYFS